MTIITLTTDFGYDDGFVGTVKGVILRIAPDVQLVDLTHSVSPQNIQQGAMALWRAVPFFPAGTVHLAVVDPGVGTKRRPIALRIGTQLFVGPDNGLFSPFLEDAEKHGDRSTFIHLTNPDYWLPKVSHTFHGRDIFGPVAAHLANGVAMEKMGALIEDPIRIELPKPEKTVKGWIAHITVMDVFGNLTTDLPASEILQKEKISFTIAGQTIHGLVESYGNKKPGELVALIDSEEFIEIAIVNGNAAQTLKAGVGDHIVVKQTT